MDKQEKEEVGEVYCKFEIHRANFRGGNPLSSVNRTKSSREKNEL